MRRTLAAACAAVMTCAVAAGAAGAASGSATSSKARTAVSGLDRVSLMTSMEGDRFEIAGGKLALTKTHNKAVAKLARTLIKDHTKSYKDAVEVAKKTGIKVETSPTPSEKWELLTVAKMRGTAFDRSWVSLEVFDHKQDIQETSDEIKYGSNPAVISDAKSDMPVLHKHLRMAQSALKTVN